MYSIFRKCLPFWVVGFLFYRFIRKDSGIVITITTTVLFIIAVWLHFAWKSQNSVVRRVGVPPREPTQYPYGMFQEELGDVFLPPSLVKVVGMYRKALPRSDLNRAATIAGILPTEAAVNQFRAVWQSLGMGEYLASGYLLPAKFGEHGQVFIPEFMLFHNRRIVG